MYLHELTREQQCFAEENHNLVYAFLREKKLRQDEYYDVVIFGYLRAVQKYLIREDLRRQYKFSTIAWWAMRCDLNHHYQAQVCPSRKVVTVSLEIIRQVGAELNTWSARTQEQLDAGLLGDEISASLTPEQVDVLRMRADGYSTREIAAVRCSPLQEIEDLFSSAREFACELCLV